VFRPTPLNHEKCLNVAKVRDWQITQLLNTQQHNTLLR